MTAVYLTRVDDAQNMARYYAMSVQPTLFGEWALVREWGRIGRAGQVKAVPYPSEAAAAMALDSLQVQKCKRGYHAAT